MEQRCTRYASERLASPRLFCLAHQNDVLHTPALVRPCAVGRDRRRGRRIHAVSEPFSSPVLLEERQRVRAERSSSRSSASDNAAARAFVRGQRRSIMAQAMFAYPD